MFEARIWFMIFANLVFCLNSLMGQKIRADLKKTYQDKDSLVVTITLKNEVNKPVYLVCGVDGLTFKDYYPDKINYGNYRAEIEAIKEDQSFEKSGDIRDTLKIAVPITKERFQLNHERKEIDIFEIVSTLQEVFINKKMSFIPPTPPDSAALISFNYLDADLYKLLQRENISVEENYCLFCAQTILFEPNERKSFNVDLSYLLLRRATYQIVFDYKTDNELFKKDIRFLKKFGFHRFKGEIISNVISIVSE